jgi:dTDP-D-glucose 4,6-dehydratase
LIKHIINDYKIDDVIHFAAQSHVQNSFEDSLQYTKDNILGTHTLLEVCRKYGKIKKFIHVSTDEVYGESMLPTTTYSPKCDTEGTGDRSVGDRSVGDRSVGDSESKKTEESILCPTNPYAATKAGAELIAQSYYHSFKLPIIITRGNNVYGPNQYPEKLIPRFIKLLNENNKVTIQGDGSNIRAFLHVSDVVKAFEIILEKGIIGEIYNIGSDEEQEYTVVDVAKLLINKIKNNNNYSQYITYIDDRPFNDKRYYISNEKIKNLGWTINIDFETGINNLTNISKNKVDKIKKVNKVIMVNKVDMVNKIKKV